MPAKKARKKAAKKRTDNLVRARYDPTYLAMLQQLGKRGLYRGMQPGEIARKLTVLELDRLAVSGEYKKLLGFSPTRPK